MQQRTIRFAPSFPDYLIEYAWILPGLIGNLDVFYKTIPMEIEVKHQIGTNETKAHILYHEAPEEDETTVNSPLVRSPHEHQPLSPFEKANHEKLNVVITKVGHRYTINAF